MDKMAYVTRVLSKPSEALFASAKIAEPIPAATKTWVDVLIQASLDPTVCQIDYVPTVEVGGVEVAPCGIILVGEHGRHLLDLLDDRPTLDSDQEGGLMLAAADSLKPPVVTRTAADIGRQPFAGNCQLVWQTRSQRVSPGDRVRILHHLEENGPCRLVDVAAVVRSSLDGVSADSIGRRNTF